MVPSLLAAQVQNFLSCISCRHFICIINLQAPSKLIYMVDISMPEEVVLRVLTLLANLASVTKRLNIDPLHLPAENKAAAPDTMSVSFYVLHFTKLNSLMIIRYAAVFGLSMVERLKKKVRSLSERHANSDVCLQARRLLDTLSD